MLNIILIIGLPGSGKTTFATTHFSHLPLIDDLSLNKDRLVGLDYNVVITDPILTSYSKDKIIKLFSEYITDFELTVYAFENNIDKCYLNLTNRMDDRKISYSYLEHLSNKYVLDSYDHIITVWSKDNGC